MSRESQGWLVPILYGVVLAVTVALVARFGAAPEDNSITVGYITPGSVESSGWNAITYRGIQEACDELGAHLLVRDQIPEFDGSCPRAVEELVRDGADMIVLNSGNYAQEMKQLLGRYPGISFYSAAASFEADNLKSFSTRLYQARYLSGIVAGSCTATGKIGFVAAWPKTEIYRGINAFALGVQRVNPTAQVVVAWTNVWDDADTETAAVWDLIRDENIDVVTYHQDGPYVVQAAEQAGIASIGYYEPVEGMSERYLTCAMCDWAPLYKALIQDYLRGSSNIHSSWMGLESGAVGLTDYSSLVPQAAQREVEVATQEMLSGHIIFSGLIYDNLGVRRCDEGEAISDDTLMWHMDWLVEGVREYEN